ncbi:hypothetical protein DV515_00006052 [Chloebia gouldiae]|uniref:Uncharacterized protein n=1 Tax=Chloebia gouldiae TaxID=44316 RepID=A0A3L8SLY0_CHLGU|nr:hypothetical protein DV515_00006052 [Chloebia gouldiae]
MGEMCCVQEYGCCVRSRFVVQWDVPVVGHQAKMREKVNLRFLARLGIPIAKGGSGEETSKDRMQN